MKIDASYVLYLMDIFDGKLSVEEIRTLDIPLLTELQKLQEAKLEKQAKELKEKQENIANEPKYINNNGQRYNRPNKL